MSALGGPDTMNVLTPGQNRILSKLGNIVNSNIGTGTPTYEGPRVAAPTDEMRQATQQARNGGYQVDPRIMQGLAPALSGAQDSSGLRDTFATALQPARVEFDRMRGEMEERYANVEGRSGAVLEMGQRMGENYGGNLNNLLGNMVFSTNQAAKDRQVQAATPALGVEGAKRSGIDSLYNLGQQNRAITGQQYQSDYNKWLEGQWYNNPALGFVPTILGTGANAIVNKPSELAAASDLIGSIGSLGGAAAGGMG